MARFRRVEEASDQVPVELTDSSSLVWASGEATQKWLERADLVRRLRPVAGLAEAQTAEQRRVLAVRLWNAKHAPSDAWLQGVRIHGESDSDYRRRVAADV